MNASDLGKAVGGIVLVIALVAVLAVLIGVAGGIVGVGVAMAYNLVLGTSFSLTTGAFAGTIVALLSGVGQASQ